MEPTSIYQTRPDRLKRFNMRMNRFFLSVPFFVILFLLAALVPIFEYEVKATLLWTVLISIILLCCDDILPVFYPALLLSTFLTRCYDSYDQFHPYAPWLAVPISALVLHFILYPRRIRVGSTFPGLCLVSVAVSLGGLGLGINLGETKWISLYYLLGLGFGLLIAYLLLRSQLKVERPYDTKQKFAVIMTLMGLYACYCMSLFYINGWSAWVETHSLPNFQSSNNLATLLLMAMPFPALLSLKNRWWFSLLILFFAGTILSTSRGGAIMGVAELLLCLVCLAIFDKKLRYVYLLLSILITLSGICLFPYVAYYLWHYTEISLDQSLLDCIGIIKEKYAPQNEARYKMLARLKDDFLENPIFGKGLLYHGNEDCYHPVKGAMNWYHVWAAQVVGSMGIVGVLAYGYQLIERIVTTVKQKSTQAWFFFLSYAGLFLMSQVNPGEFCPFPYAILAVIIFIFIEGEKSTV